MADFTIPVESPFGRADNGSVTAPRATLLSYLHYPLVMTTTFVLFAVLRSLGVSLLVSTYIPVLLAAAIVTVLEMLFPHRSEWRPPVSEVKTDLGFMTMVQLAFPPLMGFVFTFALIAPARALDLPIAALWPHGWPFWLQGLLMIFAVDFLRYWLHRAAHQNDTLWRLHSVHHSVEQMYWLNTARFHVLEKALQMTLDSLPFLLMAVDPTVLAIYYVAYATNGFFQHCNIELRYGFLNYIVGSAETHRWHHSRLPRESNANYGNTVIVWDLVFGTWFLPRERAVQELGLQDPDYPKSFWALMRAPFSH
jgi:ornithine lipid hydroxylase